MMTNRTTIASVSQAPSVSDGRGSSRITRLALAISTALCPVWALADTLPTGGTVVHGSAQITTPSSNAMTINQSSDRAVVNWNGFSIGQDSRVDIHQPNANSAILNRVTGDTTSQIHGQLNANGRVFVVNPNGIFIGPTGNVNTGSFVASTLGIRTDDFVTGNTVFEGDGSSATVENAGNVQVVTGGYAALIGGKVKNTGTIQAPLGFVGLGSGERVTLDLAGDGFLQVALPTNSDDDGVEALIENSGTIQANGGTVQISAATARNAARHAINLSGVVEARTVSGRNGRITLGGGGGGKVTVSGKVRTKTRPAIQVTQSARPALRPERGGDITITGREIALAGAEIDASGVNGGGDVRIGGEYQGGPGLPTAETLSVDAGTMIKADALKAGDGGRVILWSDLHTTFDGSISARGGQESGDGGFAEVSGKIDLSITGHADMRAPNGTWGELLLDPTNISVVETITNPANELDNDFVEAQLALGSFTIDTSSTLPDLSEVGNIFINAPIDWANGSTLALSADNTIQINAAITAPLGELDVLGFGSLSDPITTGPNGDIDVARFILGFGAWVQNSATLPLFEADDFLLPFTGSFLRVTGGDGGASPFLVADVYGLQGIGTVNGGASNWALANDIDAASTQTWLGTPGDVAPGTGLRDQGFVPLDFSGSLDGSGFTISNMFIRRYNGTMADDRAGLFARNSGTVQNLNFEFADVASSEVGVVAGENTGLIDAISVTGSTVTVLVEDSSRSAGGGVAAEIFDGGSVTNSRVTSTTVQDAPDPSLVGTNRAEDLFIGGIAGVNGFEADGTIEQSQVGGGSTVSFDDVEFAGRIGGIAGTNSGTIGDVYVTASVTADNTDADPGGSAADVGSITGVNTGTLDNVLANGPVVQIGPNPFGAVGAVTGEDDADDFTITDSYFNTDTTGLLVSGEDDSNVSGPGDLGAEAITTAGLQDAQAFFTAASANTWDFLNIWSLPQDGIDQPRLYTTDEVVSAFGETPDPSFEYIGSTTGFSISGTYGGGPGVYRFSVGDTGEVTELNDQIVLSDENVGPVTYDFPATFTSDLGVAFDVRSLENQATVTPRPITLSVAQEDPANPTGPDIPNNKIYGDLYTPSDATFTTTVTGPSIAEDADFTTAFFADPNSLISLGLEEAAAVSGSPYDLDINPATFTGLPFTNYTITFTPATLTVNPRNLTIDINDATKIFGDELIFNGTEFTTTGLVLSDEVTSLIITSDGAPASAPIDGSPYVINGNMPMGTGLDNYEILIVPGSLTINNRQLDITVNSATKTYGDTLLFNGTEFTSVGLQSGDTLTSLTITSDGAAAEAQVADGPFAINGSDPVGTGLENYAINIIPGVLTIIPAPLTITADDQTRPFGAEFTFEGNEFTVTGLVNDDSVESATLTSDGTDPALEPTGAAGVAIVITDPQGNGLDNYEVTLVGGIFVIAPGDLIITANDQTKTYGETFTFDGTEFTVVGLAEGDSVDSVTLTSAGALGTAQITDGPFAIEASDAVGTGLENYTLVFEDGSFVVVPAPLTVTANDQTKQQGLTFTFDGTEFTATGLLNSDSVDSAVLTSDGAEAEALADDSPFAIVVGDVSGTGLDNYEISRVDGTFTVQNIITPPQVNPVPGGGLTLRNPGDSISIAFPGDESTSGSISTGGPQQTLGDAEATLAVVDTLSTDLELAVQSCGNADQDFTNYMACLSELLDTYANALDQIADNLPSGLETVSATIRTARDGVNAAAARAQRRLATATSDAERSAIRAEALAEARGAIGEAQSEIRKAISLIRADDPEVAAVQQETGARIIQAFDTIDSELARAVEL